MMTPEEQAQIEQWQKGHQLELDNEKLRSMELQKNYGQISMFGTERDSNLIQWQLDLDQELERIDHLLRGNQMSYDGKGNIVWKKPEDDKLRPFNEYGVRLLMNVISFYLNRNTILSNYSEDMINWKMKDLGDELADLIFMKYEEMGMDTVDKRKMFGMIVREIIDTVHSAYLRGLNGGERESLRTARHVTQSEPIGQQTPYPNQNMQKKFSMFKPSSWK